MRAQVSGGGAADKMRGGVDAESLRDRPDYDGCAGMKRGSCALLPAKEIRLSNRLTVVTVSEPLSAELVSSVSVPPAVRDTRITRNQEFKHEAHEEESGNQYNSHNKLSILLGHNSITRWAPISFLFVRFVFKFLACCSASTYGVIRFALFCDRALCRCGPKGQKPGKGPYVSAYGF
jgi:hypothetical protein